MHFCNHPSLIRVKHAYKCCKKSHVHVRRSNKVCKIPILFSITWRRYFLQEFSKYKEDKIKNDYYFISNLYNSINSTVLTNLIKTECSSHKRCDIGNKEYDARKYAYEREMIFSPNGFNDIETEKLQT